MKKQEWDVMKLMLRPYGAIQMCILLLLLLYQCQQVAKLWQRDCAKLETFTINIQHYSQNHKIAFFRYAIGHHGQYQCFISEF